MFFIFKSEKEKLKKKRVKLLEQAYQWSAIDRKKSDEFHALADAIDIQLNG